MDAKQGRKQSQWKAIFKMISNPGEIVENRMVALLWHYSLLISGLSFTKYAEL